MRDGRGCGQGPSQRASCPGERERQWGGKENDRTEQRTSTRPRNGLNWGFCSPPQAFPAPAQLCPTLCDPMDCSLWGFSVMGFSRQEYWSGLPFFLLQGIFPTQGLNPRLLCLCTAGRFYTHWAIGEALPRPWVLIKQKARNCLRSWTHLPFTLSHSTFLKHCSIVCHKNQYKITSLFPSHLWNDMFFRWTRAKRFYHWWELWPQETRKYEKAKPRSHHLPWAAGSNCCSVFQMPLQTRQSPAAGCAYETQPFSSRRHSGIKNSQVV